MRSVIFNFIHYIVSKAPITVAFVCIALAVLAGVYGAREMELIADQDKLLSEELEYHARYMKFIERFGDLEFLYVLVEGGSKEEKINFANDLSNRLDRSDQIQKVIYKLDTSWTKDYALLYASVSELEQLSNELQNNKEDIQELKKLNSVDQILTQIDQSLQERQIQQNNQQAPAGLPMAATQIEELSPLIAAMKGEYQSDFTEFYEFEETVEQETGKTEYFWSDNQKDLLMLIMPAKDYSTLSVIEKPLDRIRTDIKLTLMDHTNISAGLTGRPALQADEMSTTNEDMKKASVVALVGVTLLFMIFFREMLRPIITMIALLCAMGWTFGFVALTLGHLNLLSSVFALILIGLGVDFGIHFLHRYQEELKETKDTRRATLGSLNRAGRGIVTGAVTSSVAFLLALLTDFKGLAELGFVAGIGILFCLMAMLVALSAFLISFDQYVRFKKHIPSPLHIHALRFTSRKPIILFAILIVITLAALPMATKVGFNDNLLELQAEGLESVEYEHKLIESSEYSTWYSAFIRDDLPSTRQLVQVLRDEPLVAKVDSVIDVLPKNVDEKQDILEDINTILAGDFDYEQNYNPSNVVYQRLRRNLQALFNQLDQARAQMEQMQQAQAQQEQQRGQQQGQMSAEQMAQMQAQQQQMAAMPSPEQLEPLRELMNLLSGDGVEQRLKEANQELIAKPLHALQSIKQYASHQSIEIDELPQTIHDLYISDDGAFLVMAFPRDNIWEHEALDKFITAMRDIDPEVTGTPIQIYESGILMRDSFRTIGMYSVLAVALFVFIDFRKISALLLIMVPLLTGVLWLVQIMGTLDVNLNMANFFAIPILIGIGVDNAVHLFHRYEETGDIEKAIATTGTTLTLTSLTTGVGFGSLMLASHQGLASLGQLMAIGTFTCWFSCVVFMPILVKLFLKVKAKAGA